MAIPAIDVGRLLPVEEAARLLGVSTRTVRRWIKSGRLRVAAREGRRIFIAREAASALRRKRLTTAAPTGLVAEAKAIQQDILAWRGGRRLPGSSTDLIRSERDLLRRGRKPRL